MTPTDPRSLSPLSPCRAEDRAGINMDLMTAADRLLSGPIEAIKRVFEHEEVSTNCSQHVQNMSFAQELVMMPPFSRDKAALPAVVNGIDTTATANTDSGKNVAPPNTVGHHPGAGGPDATPFDKQAAIPATASANAPSLGAQTAVGNQQLKDSQPMFALRGAPSHDPLSATMSTNLSSMIAPSQRPGLQPYVDAHLHHGFIREKNGRKPLNVGIGAHFEQVGKHFIVRSLVKDSPAHRSGLLQEGDYLVHVDGCGTDGRGMHELSKKLLGLEGSNVQLAMRRPGGSEYSVTLVRKNVQKRGLSSFLCLSTARPLMPLACLDLPALRDSGYADFVSFAKGYAT
jgi:hypothetical protein